MQLKNCAQSEIETQLKIVAECIIDIESLVKCNNEAVTEEAKITTAKAVKVLSERIRNALETVGNLLRY